MANVNFGDYSHSIKAKTYVSKVSAKKIENGLNRELDNLERLAKIFTKYFGGSTASLWSLQYYQVHNKLLGITISSAAKVETLDSYYKGIVSILWDYNDKINKLESDINYLPVRPIEDVGMQIGWYLDVMVNSKNSNFMRALYNLVLWNFERNWRLAFETAWECHNNLQKIHGEISEKIKEIESYIKEDKFPLLTSPMQWQLTWFKEDIKTLFPLVKTKNMLYRAQSYYEIAKDKPRMPELKPKNQITR